MVDNISVEIIRSKKFYTAGFAFCFLFSYKDSGFISPSFRQVLVTWPPFQKTVPQWGQRKNSAKRAYTFAYVVCHETNFHDDKTSNFLHIITYFRHNPIYIVLMKEEEQV